MLHVMSRRGAGSAPSSSEYRLTQEPVITLPVITRPHTSFLPDEQPGGVHERETGQEAAHGIARGEPSRSAPCDEAHHLDDDLQRGSGCDREEKDAQTSLVT